MGKVMVELNNPADPKSDMKTIQDALVGKACTVSLQGGNVIVDYDGDRDPEDAVTDMLASYGVCCYVSEYDDSMETTATPAKQNEPAVPWGVSPSTESYILLPTGNYFVFESTHANSKGTSYVRIVNSKGGEIVYWNCDEWEESPTEVMGAICGAMCSINEVKKPEYYKFAPDVKFPSENEK